MPAPTVGRIVRYYAADAFGDSGEGPYASIVTKVHNESMVNLNVFMAGSSPMSSVPFYAGEGATPTRYWVWPPQA